MKTDENKKNVENTTRIAILYCQHSIVNDQDITSAFNKVNGFSINPSMQPCSSKVQLSHVLNILDKEADGVEVVACPDKACRFLVGSCRAEKRITYGRQLLERIKVGAERLGITHRAGLSAEDLVQIAAKRAEAVKNISKKGENQ